MAPNRGVLADAGGTPWSDREIAAVIGGDTTENLGFVTELLAKGVAHRNENGAVYSRRLVRDEEERKAGAKRQARLRENGGGDPDKWAAIRVPILQRDGYMCAYCGRKASTVDHVIPKSKGGTDDSSNLVACCKRCNQKKSNRTPEDAGMSFWSGFDKSRLSIVVITPLVTPEAGTANATANACKKISEAYISEIYKNYPRKEGRGNAFKAIASALERLLKGQDTPGELFHSLDDAAVYLAQRVKLFASTPAGQAGEFTPHPATWFNQKRYLDDESNWSRRGERTTSKHEQQVTDNRANLLDDLGDVLSERVGRSGEGFQSADPQGGTEGLVKSFRRGAN